MRDTEPSARSSELLDVAREEPVAPGWRGAGSNGADEGSTERVPCLIAARAEPLVLRICRGRTIRSALPRMPFDRVIQPRRADDFAHRLIEKLGRYREMLRYHRRDLRRLAAVQREKGRQRHEHRQPDTGRAIGVDGESGPVPRCHESRITDS